MRRARLVSIKELLCEINKGSVPCKAKNMYGILYVWLSILSTLQIGRVLLHLAPV